MAKIRKSLITSLTVTILLTLILVGQVSISPAVGDYNVVVSNDVVNVRIHGDLLQAVNSPPLVNGSTAFGSIPVFKFHLEGTNSSTFSAALNAALTEKSPAASIDQMILDTNSNGTDLHYSLSFNVLRVVTDRQDVKTVNLSWRSFVVGNDLTVGNTSLNAVVPKYLGSGISRYVQLLPSQQQPTRETRRWWWNGQNIAREQVGSSIQNALLFDFSSLSTPLQMWDAFPNIRSRTISYQSATGFNLTFTNQITEPGEVGTLYTNAVYKIKTVIEVPLGSFVYGDGLILEAQIPWRVWLMLTLVIASSGFLAGSIVLERRLQQTHRNTTARKSRR